MRRLSTPTMQSPPPTHASLPTACFLLSTSYREAASYRGWPSLRALPPMYFLPGGLSTSYRVALLRGLPPMVEGSTPPSPARVHAHTCPCPPCPPCPHVSMPSMPTRPPPRRTPWQVRTRARRLMEAKDGELARLKASSSDASARAASAERALHTLEAQV